MRHRGGASARFKIGIAVVISEIARLANYKDHKISDYVNGSWERKKPRWSWQSKTEGVTETDVVMLSTCNLLFHERSPLMDLLIYWAQGSRRQSELKFHAIHQTVISWHEVVGHIMVQSYIKNSHSHLLLQWELHMAAITSIKDPLVNLNTNAYRQTHVDLQQPFEDIQNFTWLL